MRQALGPSGRQAVHRDVPRKGVVGVSATQGSETGIDDRLHAFFDSGRERGVVDRWRGPRKVYRGGVTHIGLGVFWGALIGRASVHGAHDGIASDARTPAEAGAHTP